jgi:Flp pilus assembly pilin Flp
MHQTILKLFVLSQSLRKGEEGSETAEYALAVALIAAACISSISGLATAIENALPTLKVILPSKGL